MKRLWLASLIGCISVILLLSGCNTPPGGAGSSSTTNPPATQPPPGQTASSAVELMPIKVYFAAKDAQHVVAETHKVKKDSHVLQYAMEALVAGPRDTTLRAVVPPGTKVKSVQVIDRTALVDFTAAMIKKGFGGSSMEILTVGAIVNTLTEFPEVERVQILVEGKKVTTLFGHLDVSDPLSRSPGIIKK